MFPRRLPARAALLGGAALGGVLFWVGGAGAQVPARELGAFWARSSRAPFAQGGLITAARGQAWSGLPNAVALPISERFTVIRAADTEKAAWLAATPGLRWSPPRHLLMDRARASLRVDEARAHGAGSGQGVVIGIVDSGVDAQHADLRRADGSTRLAWWLDFASNPAGTHPELESELGCQAQAGLRCQILDAADLDRRLANDVVGDEPRDMVGHGTVVASIAAGNGSWGGGSAFAGVAPEATLIAARVTGNVGTIADSDVVLATRFVFERARELGMPAVVNLSLGSDFGAHDGSSELGQALAELVGPAWPGRAIVVAAGNSGQLQNGVAGGHPERFGVHTTLSATPGERGRVQLATPVPLTGLDTTRASLFVWIELYPPAQLSVGVVLPDGSRVEPVALDHSRVFESDELVAAVVHGVGGDSAAVTSHLPDVPLGDVLPSRGAAVVLVDGRWPAGQGFEIELEGEGHAELWVQSEGDLAPEGGTAGALFTGATVRGTVTIPAAHQELIAVGASVDRVDWIDATGAPVSVARLPVTPTPEPGAAAFFSSAGPNSLGDFKPDLVAPGAFVIAAMASAADPRRGAFGIFTGGLCAGLGCQIISDGYALTAGTSMAAPMVSGAVALLLERQPELTQPELRGLLIAGSGTLAAPDVASREGAGVLDVAGSVQASVAPPRDAGARPSGDTSRLRAAADSIPADAQRPLSVLLWLKDASGAVFDAGVERVGVQVSGGELQSSAVRIAPGAYEFAVLARPSDEAELGIHVAIDQAPLLSLALPIDGEFGRGAAERDAGGCELSPAHTGRLGRSAPLALAGLLSLVLRRRARRPQ